MTNQNPTHETALAFRALHIPGRPLVLPNAWDTASARLVEEAGAAAVATTSAGLAWDLGTADGDRLDRDRALGAVARVAAAVRVPVSADIESGYAKDAAGVGDTIRAVLAAGAVGVNIEDALYGREGGGGEGDDGEGAGDGGRGPLRPVAEQAERIAAARAAADAAGVPLFINARIDTVLRGAGGVEETLERAAAFLAAGADGIFVPGVVDPGTVKSLVAGVEGPLNVLAGPGAPSVAELAALGVARISTGSSIAQAAHAVVRRAARELLSAGTYDSLTGGLDYVELNTLLGGAR
ncbi:MULTISPECIES: isocitrate lyase/phosphoenolpyruvate mutase family protein [Streptomyces]|jgi:2-methylisocitrate lyase-like PEP mutase family enzyme|uniref:isocitrate lyase/PEP mutase family protein n=1 Tax=Streptomyces TaxID=1883 RepID=UPI0011642FCF|nr:MULTISPECIES: isocitrate lyase/phosphoenolpyruvate mutase family protein [unclassified Streptomyces]NMI62484.1 isocitrate lyase/phosphoenolpyruvate mutase family protein [Streptomyces sp. RLA2-12]QDN61483.1 isocitrate lyase/phosphoenolpyruvate mutase family protein [Streptomyces sp. S1D4-20]QDN71536.1 isocitrate lyase/phosphoenolpyruvate mutase family protein [Streptomyces sp. S1D4-14]QDO53992.1 isocitrate lyase/phosphoenolpyruvate mutase family protein [Streptomyces sp. RLB3-5]QDO64237.1 i